MQLNEITVALPVDQSCKLIEGESCLLLLFPLNLSPFVISETFLVCLVWSSSHRIMWCGLSVYIQFGCLCHLNLVLSLENVVYFVSFDFCIQIHIEFWLTCRTSRLMISTLPFHCSDLSCGVEIRLLLHSWHLNLSSRNPRARQFQSLALCGSRRTDPERR